MKKINTLFLLASIVSIFSGCAPMQTSTTIKNSTSTEQNEVNHNYESSVMLLNLSLLNAHGTLDSKFSKDQKTSLMLSELNKIDLEMASFLRKTGDFNLIPSDCREQITIDLENYDSLLNYSMSLNDKDSIIHIYKYILEDLLTKKNTRWGLEEVANIGLINVTVQVIDNVTNKPLNGFNVYMRPAMSIEKRFIQVFNPTNAAIKAILPGVKVIWIEKNRIKIGERREVISWNAPDVIYKFQYGK